MRATHRLVLIKGRLPGIEVMHLVLYHENGHVALLLERVGDRAMLASMPGRWHPLMIAGVGHRGKMLTPPCGVCSHDDRRVVERVVEPSTRGFGWSRRRTCVSSASTGVVHSLDGPLSLLCCPADETSQASRPPSGSSDPCHCGDQAATAYTGRSDARIARVPHGPLNDRLPPLA